MPFVDAPDSNVFHDDIAWLADAGVTVGSNPPDNTEFCPADNVTREQMAAFLHSPTPGIVSVRADFACPRICRLD